MPRKTVTVSLGGYETKINLQKHSELMGITHFPYMGDQTVYLHYIYNTSFEYDYELRTFFKSGNGVEIPDNWVWMGAVACLPGVEIFNALGTAPRFTMGSVWHIYEEISR